MTRVAVLKPDHLGDFVLGSAAIRAIANHYGPDAVTIFHASGAATLAKFMFSNIERRNVDMAHLARSGRANVSLGALRAELDQFDIVFCLRADPIVEALMNTLQTQWEISSSTHTIHETANHKHAVCRRIPNYSRTAMMTGAQLLWPAHVRHVGLSLGSGFPVNKWATTYWYKLAAMLAADGIELTLIGGPGELDELKLLSAAIGNRRHRILVGSDDTGALFAGLDPVDLVVASDGGTAHLCSLRKPIVSVFGASPWRRFAPFGWSNLVLTRNLPCSPCVQFSHDAVNGCFTRECLARVTPKHVYAAVHSNGVDFSSIRNVWVQKGTSHAFEG